MPAEGWLLARQSLETSPNMGAKAADNS